MSDPYKTANPWWWITKPRPWVAPFWLGYASKLVLLVILAFAVYLIATHPTKKHPVPVFAPPVETDDDLNRRLLDGK